MRLGDIVFCSSRRIEIRCLSQILFDRSTILEKSVGTPGWDTLQPSVEIIPLPPCTMLIGIMFPGRMLHPSTLFGGGRGGIL